MRLSNRSISSSVVAVDPPRSSKASSRLAKVVAMPASRSIRRPTESKRQPWSRVMRSVCAPVMAASCSVRRCSAGKASESRGTLAAPGAKELWKLLPMCRTRPHCSGDKRSRSAPATRISDCKTAPMPPSR